MNQNFLKVVLNSEGNILDIDCHLDNYTIDRNEFIGKK